MANRDGYADDRKQHAREKVFRVAAPGDQEFLGCFCSSTLGAILSYAPGGGQIGQRR
jgi:hypothetical protein